MVCCHQVHEIQRVSSFHFHSLFYVLIKTKTIFDATALILCCCCCCCCHFVLNGWHFMRTYTVEGFVIFIFFCVLQNVGKNRSTWILCYVHLDAYNENEIVYCANESSCCLVGKSIWWCWWQNYTEHTKIPSDCVHQIRDTIYNKIEGEIVFSWRLKRRHRIMFNGQKCILFLS